MSPILFDPIRYISSLTHSQIDESTLVAKATDNKIFILRSFEPSTSSYLNFIKIAIKKGRIISKTRLPNVNINAHRKLDVKSLLYEL